MSALTSASCVSAPTIAAATGTTQDIQELTGAGNVSRVNATALTVGAYATIRNGPTYTIRCRFAGTSPTAVTSDKFCLMPGQEYSWLVEQQTRFVAAIEAAGTAGNVIEAVVWTSSPR